MLLDTKLLRQKVRDLAVSGELSNTNIKANLLLDDDTYIDFPFSIPDTWQWITLGELVPYGKSDHVSYTDIDANTWVLGLEEVEKHTGKLLAKKRGIEFKSSKSVFYEGNVLFSKVNPHLNKVIVADEDGVCTSEIIPIDVQKSKLPICARFLQYVLMSSYFVGYSTKKAFGVKMPRLSTVDAKNALIPLPPLEEQKRIVAKVEEIFAELDAIDKAYSDLEQLGTLSKSKILDLAIKGQLVPQLDSEPDSLDYLKELNPKVKLVDTCETNYSIPDKWRIVKLGSICTKIVDGDHNPPKGELEPTKYLMLSAKNINNNSLIINDAVRFLSKENFETSHSRTQLSKDDVLLTIVGTLGRSCVVEDVSENITFQRSVACLSTLIYSKYLKYFLDAPDVQKYITINAKGTAQKGFYLNQLKNLHVAIPPLEEQKRIVAKVEELFALIDAMKK